MLKLRVIKAYYNNKCKQTKFTRLKKVEIIKLDFRVIQLCAVSKRYQGITGHSEIEKVE